MVMSLKHSENKYFIKYIASLFIGCETIYKTSTGTRDEIIYRELINKQEINLTS